MANKKLSFHLHGFWFHLTSKDDRFTLFVDQTGLEWVRKGSVLTSAGGGLVYAMPSAKEQEHLSSLSNKDFFMAQREAYYNNRIHQNFK